MSTITLHAAHLELLDHLGEDVHLGIMLPDDMPWAGTYGALGHVAHHLIDLARDSEQRFYFSDDDREQERNWAEMLLQAEDRSGQFTVNDFIIPLNAARVTAVHRMEDGDYLALDFMVSLGADSCIRVRVTFAEHAR